MTRAPIVPVGITRVFVSVSCVLTSDARFVRFAAHPRGKLDTSVGVTRASWLRLRLRLRFRPLALPRCKLLSLRFTSPSHYSSAPALRCFATTSRSYGLNLAAERSSQSHRTSLFSTDRQTCLPATLAFRLLKQVTRLASHFRFRSTQCASSFRRSVRSASRNYQLASSSTPRHPIAVH